MPKKRFQLKSLAVESGQKTAESVNTTLEKQTTSEVLKLQRAVGNHNMQRMVAQNRPLLKNPHHTIQRAETGIRTTSSTNHFTKAIFDFAQKNTNQSKPIADLVTALADSVNVELKGAGSPPISIVAGAPGASGEFDFSTWVIELNQASAFPGAVTVSDLTDDQISDVANTIYHESRHSEQWFRIARNRAAKALQQGANSTQRQQAAAQISNDMDIPLNIALEACSRPLYGSWNSKFGGGTDKKIDEAEAWDASIYGVNSDYRNEIVLGDFNDNVKEFKGHITAAKNAIPPNYNTLGKNAKKPIIQQFKQHCKDARQSRDFLTNGLATLIQPEIDRLDAIGTRNTVEETMLNHLNVVKTSVETIIANKPFNPIKIVAVQQAAKDMKDELYQAYLDLPEESDAWPTGEAVSTQYSNLLNPAPVTN